MILEVIYLLHICICDDEKVQRNNLKVIISTQLGLKGIDFHIAECEDGESLLESLNKNKNCFDIIFLDIEMNGMNGIETAKQIRDINDIAVIIFVTGFTDYVFNGYEVRALNYVLKPYKEEKIVDILSQALKQIDSIQNKFLMIQLNRNIYRIYFHDIIYFISDKRKLIVVTDENTYEFYGKLDDIEKEVPSFFIRIHQRYLVNLNFVSCVEDNELEIKGQKLPISRSKYQDLMIAFAKTMLR
jgi:DNA-binding LytR/AlgR family response regulator